MKNRFRFSLSIATEKLSPSAPVIFRGEIQDIIKKAKQIGYDGIELQLRDPDKLDAEAVKKYCEAEKMGISAIATGLEYSLNGLSMIDDDNARREKMRGKLIKDIELAGFFGCPVIIGCVRGNIPSDRDPSIYLQRFQKEMLLLSDVAEQHHVTLVLEAINFYLNNYLNTIQETCDFIDSLGRSNIKLHIDTHHMVIEEINMARAVRYAGSRIGYVHFADNNRMYPGAGSIDFKSIVEALDSVHYNGYITLEIIPRPSDEACAVRGLEYLNSLMNI